MKFVVYRVFFIMSSLLLLGCQKPIPHQNEDELTSQQAAKKITSQEECQKIDQIMQKIDHHSAIEALNQINVQLKQCIATVENAQQLKWLESSTEMYQRFLEGHQQTKEYYTRYYPHFEKYTISLLDNENVWEQLDRNEPVQGDITLFRELAPRDQYLFNHQQQAYIHLQALSEGVFEFHRKPQYVIDIFASTLPKDQQDFIQRMAKDNRDPTFGDASLTISWQELVERALFWERYVQKYPKGYFTPDAKKLFEDYSNFIFFGLDNTPVSENYTTDSWIDEDALQQIKFLAKNHNTQLNKKAQKFLSFIKTPTEQRQEKFKLQPIELFDEYGHKKHPQQIAHEQLRLALNIKPRDWNTSRDCYTDAICFRHKWN